MQIYYGSNVIVNQPKIITENLKKDCGLIKMDPVKRTQ